MSGVVYLVGAGPGDYGLITLKALECIKIADTIIYDRLADQRLLSEAAPDAEMIYVGKASKNHVLCQEDINQLLVDKALAQKTVVRLKGGDPFVFGRGGEEALKLWAHNIEFEIVPGISSAIAVPAYAGIPVTHRNMATSFAVITGHEDPAKTTGSIKWDNLAQATDTLVFLMGIENLPQITAQLIAHGRLADTPAAIIQWGTKSEQQTVVTNLQQAVQAVREHNITPPAVFIVGEVVNLRSQLAWFDRKPLFGKRILVTRAREQLSELTAGLEQLGASCIEAPAIEIVPPDSYEPLQNAVAKLADYDWLIFTRTNGVKRFFQYLYSHKKDSRALSGLKICAIGVKTAEELLKFGIRADIVPAEFRVEGSIEALRAKISDKTKILIPRALITRDILPEKLREIGAKVDIVPVYKTISGSEEDRHIQEMLAAGKVDVITFTSSSTVKNFLKTIGAAKKYLSNIKLACIGPVTAAACLENGLEPEIIAGKYTVKDLIKAIKDYYSTNRS